MDRQKTGLRCYLLSIVYFSTSMPLGPFGEVVGTTGTLEALGADAQTYRSKVIAPRNPKLVKGDEDEHKV